MNIKNEIYNLCLGMGYFVMWIIEMILLSRYMSFCDYMIREGWLVYKEGLFFNTYARRRNNFFKNATGGYVDSNNLYVIEMQDGVFLRTEHSSDDLSVTIELVNNLPNDVRIPYDDFVEALRDLFINMKGKEKNEP